MPSFTDNIRNTVTLHQYPPQKIISLVPSITELLHDLGLQDEVIAITKFCVHPNEWFRSKQRIGGTKNLHIEQIKNLQPDLIIAGKEENVKEQIDELAQTIPVYVTDVTTYHEALQMILDIGELTARENKAAQLVNEIEKNFSSLQIREAVPAAYLIWRNPYITVGGDTFISSMMERCGLQNIFKAHERYPEIPLEQLPALNCRLLLLSSEPYPFKEKHLQEIQTILPGIKIILADGEMFSWYGSRMLHAAAYFQQLMAECKKILQS
ncbi:MAG TPA: helical backbone metal receptor [Chitinophagaceae bacterium]|nr:helical backbone metal receptor [Chitinophagaceae bacterium]